MGGYVVAPAGGGPPENRRRTRRRGYRRFFPLVAGFLSRRFPLHTGGFWPESAVLQGFRLGRRIIRRARREGGGPGRIVPFCRGNAPGPLPPCGPLPPGP